jgi:hypothetical protein
VVTPPPRWGAIATVAWSAGLIVFFFAVQGAIAVILIAASMHAAPPNVIEREILRLQQNGDMISVVGTLSSPLCVAALFGVVKLKSGATIADSLALGTPPGRVLARWLGAMLALAIALDALSLAIGKPIVPEFQNTAWSSATDKAYLALAVIVAAPLMEELVFRGFILTGLMDSALRPAGAVAVASAAWASIHTQYDLYGMASIFAMGILLGMARVRTRYTLVPMAMHALANAWATAETVLVAASST